jgi:hypothetical protein
MYPMPNPPQDLVHFALRERRKKQGFKVAKKQGFKVAKFQGSQTSRGHGDFTAENIVNYKFLKP